MADVGPNRIGEVAMPRKTSSSTSRPRSTRRARSTGRPRVGVVFVAVVLVGVVGAAAYTWHDAVTAALTGGSGRPQALDPPVFADGACVAYPPTSGDRGKTVFLDAGHGGIDPGGVGTTQGGTTIDEGHENLPVELDVMSILRGDGFRVVVSRTGDTTVLRLGPGDVADGSLTLQGAHDDVAARAQCANDARADALVGIYYDAAGSSSEAGSLTAYDADRPFSAANRKLADLVQHDVLAAMNGQGWGIPNDGVRTDGSLGSLNGDPAASGLAAQAAAYGHLIELGPAMAGFFTTPSTMPGAIVEPLYLTDPFEGSLADSASAQTTIARGIALAVEQFLAPPSSSTTSTT
jgi:N-acetylmuramoyl-L-alanine amidase